VRPPGTTDAWSPPLPTLHGKCGRSGQPASACRATIPALAKALDHPISNIRQEAASALHAIGDVAAISHLERALADPDVEVRKIAARALTRVTTRA